MPSVRSACIALPPAFALSFSLAVCASPLGAQSVESFVVPAWAYPSPPPVTGPRPPAAPLDSVTLLHLPGSSAAFTAPQLRDQFNAPDWYPASHRAMPATVAHGRRPSVIACGFCHLPDGSGRPENATLAGLPAPYIVRQVAEIRARSRQSAWLGTFRPYDLMRAIADSVTDAELAEAARYFSRVKFTRRAHVVEATQIPRVVPSLGLYVPAPDSGTEPLGARLIEMVTDAERHEMRDPRARYVAYVPPGSIARGRVLATKERANGVKACTSCHGPQLRGVAEVPPLAGRSPSYILRQLLAFRTGRRAAPESAPMREVTAGLSIDDMIAAASFAGSRRP